MSSLKPIVPETSNLHVTRFEPLVAPRALLIIDTSIAGYSGGGG